MLLVSWKLMKPALLITYFNLNFVYLLRLRYQLLYTNLLIKFCQKQQEISFDADNRRQRNQIDVFLKL